MAPHSVKGVMSTVLQANEEVAKNLQQIKGILYGDGGAYNPRS